MTDPHAYNIVFSMERFSSKSSLKTKPSKSSSKKNRISMDMPPRTTAIIMVAMTGMIVPFVLPNFERYISVGSGINSAQKNPIIGIYTDITNIRLVTVIPLMISFEISLEMV